MATKRIILEMGTGNDLHGGDYTKAALRAVQDAIHHSSLTVLRTLKVNPKTSMFVEVTIGVQQPDKVDAEKVRASRNCFLEVLENQRVRKNAGIKAMSSGSALEGSSAINAPAVNVMSKMPRKRLLIPPSSSSRKVSMSLV